MFLKVVKSDYLFPFCVSTFIFSYSPLFFNNLKWYSTTMNTKTILATIKLINQDLVWSDRFDGTNFIWWQDRLKFLLIALKIFYMLKPSMASICEPSEEVRAEERKDKRTNWFVEVTFLMPFLIIYTISAPPPLWAKEIRKSLEKKYKVEEEGTEKFLILKYFNFKMHDSVSLLPQVHELQVIVNKMNVVKIEFLESFQVGALIAQLHPTWKGYREKILHNSEDISLKYIQKHLGRIRGKR